MNDFLLFAELQRQRIAKLPVTFQTFSEPEPHIRWTEKKPDRRLMGRFRVTSPEMTESERHKIHQRRYYAKLRQERKRLYCERYNAKRRQQLAERAVTQIAHSAMREY